MTLSPEAIKELLAAPAEDAPPSVTPNFEHPENRNGLARGVITSCLIISTLSLAIRGYSRLRLERNFGLEEVLIILSYGAYCGGAYSAYALIRSPGYFVHTWELRNDDVVRQFFLVLVYSCCYSVVLALVKTAILADWCRLLVPAQRSKSVFWQCSICLMVIQAIWSIACLVLLNLQCQPHEAIWNFYLPRKCYDMPKVMLFLTSIQLVTDVAMVVLPQGVVWGLHLTLRQRLGVSIVFGAGILAVISACFRLANTVVYQGSGDAIYHHASLLLWASVEMTCGFFIFSVPSIPRILKENGLGKKLRSLAGRRSKHTGNGTTSYPQGTYHESRRRGGSDAFLDFHRNRDGWRPFPRQDTSESQERLQTDMKRDKDSLQVIHMTSISISTEAGPAQEAAGVVTPWRKEANKNNININQNLM